METGLNKLAFIFFKYSGFIDNCEEIYAEFQNYMYNIYYDDCDGRDPEEEFDTQEKINLISNQGKFSWLTQTFIDQKHRDFLASISFGKSIDLIVYREAYTHEQIWTVKINFPKSPNSLKDFIKLKINLHKKRSSNEEYSLSSSSKDLISENDIDQIVLLYQMKFL